MLVTYKTFWFPFCYLPPFFFCCKRFCSLCTICWIPIKPYSLIKSPCFWSFLNAVACLLRPVCFVRVYFLTYISVSLILCLHKFEDCVLPPNSCRQGRGGIYLDFVWKTAKPSRQPNFLPLLNVPNLRSFMSEKREQNVARASLYTHSSQNCSHKAVGKPLLSDFICVVVGEGEELNSVFHRHFQVIHHSRKLVPPSINLLQSLPKSFETE